MTLEADDSRWGALANLAAVARCAWPRESRVGYLEELRTLAEDLQRDAVADARAAGVSWQVLANEVGLTRQAAWQRWADQRAHEAAQRAGQTSLLDEV